MSRMRFGLYIGDRENGSAYEEDSDGLIMDEVDGWSHNMDCRDYQHAFEGLADILNAEEYSDIGDRVVRLIEYPNDEINDGDKVEL